MSEKADPLESVRILIDLIDPFVMQVIVKRMTASRDVGLIKSGQSRPKVVREDREDAQMIAMEATAKRLGINSHFARSVLYELIRESCKLQDMLIQAGDPKFDPRKNDPPDVVQRKLRYNLLMLTASVAPDYDSRYGSDSVATTMYTEYERGLIRNVMATCDSQGLALDLGCATGPVTRMLTERFTSVVGIDVSPIMIRYAKKRNADMDVKPVYVRQDLEEGIKADDGSASFVVMNMGTTSDVGNTGKILSEISRVLVSGGRAFLSFYNKNGLVHQYTIPWMLPFAATYSETFDCLWVRCGRKKIVPVKSEERDGAKLERLVTIVERAIQAKRYTKDEVDALVREACGLKPIEWFSYPTFGSILPSDVLGMPGMKEFVHETDVTLSPQLRGAYLILVCKKI